MLTNTAATLYNAYGNPETGRQEWRRTELAAVHWEDNRTGGVTGSGVQVVESTTVLIGFDVETGKRYLPPKQYAATPPDEIDRYWTLRPMKDRMIKGIVPGDQVLETPAELDKAHDSLITVKAVDTRDYGPAWLRHWEVTGA